MSSLPINVVIEQVSDPVSESTAIEGVSQECIQALTDPVLIDVTGVWSDRSSVQFRFISALSDVMEHRISPSVQQAFIEATSRAYTALQLYSY